MSEIEELKQLTPEERIRRLKEIEEERNREIDEAETLIRDSMREISDASEKKHAPIRQVTANDISQLLTAEEKRMFKTARFQESGQGTGESEGEASMQNLEEVAEDEAKNKQQQSHAPIYGRALEEARKGIDYNSHVTTTGADTKGGESVHEIYSSRTVTGANEEQKQMYERGKEAAGDISGSYERKREEDEKKRKSEWRI